MARSSPRAPAVDVVDDALDGVEIRREQLFGRRRREIVRGRQFDDVGDRAVFCGAGRRRPADEPLDVAGPAQRIAVRLALEARDAGYQRGKCRRRLQDQHRQRIGAAAGFEKPFAQVQQMAARLEFDRAAHVGGIDSERSERILSGDDDVVGENRAELERERVERLRELARAKKQRRREAGVVPRVDACRGGAQIVARHRFHHCQGSRRRRGTVPVRVVRMMRVGRGRARAIDRQRLQPAAENATEIALERANRFRNHAAILRVECSHMRLRQLNIGCFGGGTGLPSLLGGLKHNPWLHLNAVVTMFDSGGSSGQLRDELGVLPPGDILKCALALARNSREARRVLLARLPTLEHARLGGHTGGNLLLSMMQRYSGDFLDAIDGLRALLGCRGRVWPVSVQAASVCAEYGDGKTTRGEVEIDAGQVSGRLVRRIWLEPPVSIHPAVATAIGQFDAIIIGPGSFYTSLMPIFLVRGVPEALAEMKGPIILIANLLTEGRGMFGFTAGDAVNWIEQAIHRKIDVVITNMMWPSPSVLGRYGLEHKEPLAPGNLPDHCELVGGEFWTGDIARHDRLRLAYAIWSVLSRRLLTES